MPVHTIARRARAEGYAIGMASTIDDPKTILIALVTAPPDEAEGIARALVEARVAACVNVLPGVTSFYRWEGEVARDDEMLLIVKTTASAFDALSTEVQRIHPYDVPEIVAFPLTAGLPAYLTWVAESVGG